ncbi:MAG: hypothetical protein OXH75_03985 [Acidobacteria bacterium]|nr:hypothetical protein [Acidobacteriota bacterium]
MPRIALAALLVLAVAAPGSSQRVETLQPTRSLPPHIVGELRLPAVFQETPDGRRFLFDRRGHRVHRLDPGADRAAVLVEIGPEPGRLLGAAAFDLGRTPERYFVVADAPEGRERVQIFNLDGRRVSGFSLPGRAMPRVTLDDTVLSGIGTLEFTGREILMNQPELGGLVTRFSLRGQPFHTFGVLRSTGHESDRDVHLALNSGIPRLAPDGSYYFVFQTGVPMYRKYDARGTLLFERHVEGPALDATINSMPTTWPRRTHERGVTLPFIPPTVRTAAVDRAGNLWIALSVPVIFVYDPNGEKIRTVRLRAAGILRPSSLYFPDRRRMLVAPGGFEFTVW